MAGFQEKLNDVFLPAALGALIYFSQSVSSDLKKIAIDIATLVAQSGEHERRIQALESISRTPHRSIP